MDVDFEEIMDQDSDEEVLSDDTGVAKLRIYEPIVESAE